MAKTLLTKVKLQIPGGSATPAPPVGTALGPHGIQIQDFVSQFNDRTQDMRGTVVPVELSIYEDRSFDFILKKPPMAELIKKALKLDKGSGEPNTKKVGKLNQKQLAEIAEQKMPDLNAYDIEAAKKIVAGTAKQMGIEIDPN